MNFKYDSDSLWPKPGAALSSGINNVFEEKAIITQNLLRKERVKMGDFRVLQDT